MCHLLDCVTACITYWSAVDCSVKFLVVELYTSLMCESVCVVAAQNEQAGK